MQAPKSIVGIAPRSQPPMQKSFRPFKIGTDFADDGVITKKQYVL
jgi:hypothetical protein